MNTKVFILLLALSLSVFGETFLPKQSDYLPVSTLYANDIVRSGTDSFWRSANPNPSSDGIWGGTIISSYPVRPNAVTKVTVYMETGDRFHIAVGRKNIAMMMSNGDPWTYPNTVSYWTQTGGKCKNIRISPYGSRAYEGDNITMTIDLRPFKGWVSYAKNGLDMGIAFSGLEDWGTDVYIMFGIFNQNHRLKILEYSVT